MVGELNLQVDTSECCGWESTAVAGDDCASELNMVPTAARLGMER